MEEGWKGMGGVSKEASKATVMLYNVKVAVWEVESQWWTHHTKSMWKAYLETYYSHIIRVFNRTKAFMAVTFNRFI